MIDVNKKGFEVDCSAMRRRQVEVEVTGRKTVVDVSPGVTSEQIQDGLDYMYAMLCQSCYVEYTIADCFLIISEKIFRKKKVFKFGLKKHFTECQKSLRDTMKIYECHMDDDYYSEYSGTMYDMVAQKIEKLRKMCEDKLRGLDCKYNPYLCSYAIMIQNLVQNSSDTFKHVVEVAVRLYGCNFADSYKQHNAKMAYTQADNILYDIMHDGAKKFKVNIIENKKIKDIWCDIIQTLYNQNNAKKARLAAFYDMPPEKQALYDLREDGFCQLKEGVRKIKK